MSLCRADALDDGASVVVVVVVVVAPFPRQNCRVSFSGVCDRVGSFRASLALVRAWPPVIWAVRTRSKYRYLKGKFGSYVQS